MSGHNKVSTGSTSGANKYAVANEIIVITGTDISTIGDIIFLYFLIIIFDWIKGN
jgi:hypothetical protein